MRSRARWRRVGEASARRSRPVRTRPRLRRRRSAPRWHPCPAPGATGARRRPLRRRAPPRATGRPAPSRSAPAGALVLADGPRARQVVLDVKQQPPDTLPWPPTPALLPERTLTGPAFQSLAAGLVAGAAVVALPSLMAQGKDATGARFAVGAAVGVSGLVGFFARKPRPLDANVRANASQRDAWKRRVDAVKAENAARLRTTRLVVRAGPETIAERGSP